MRKILATFSGNKYHGPTQRIVEDAPKFGVDGVLVYDDHWLDQNKQKECAEAKWLFDHHDMRGFGWFFWKSVVIQDALPRVSPGDVVLFTDADTYPIHDLSIIYQIAERDGIMLFASNCSYCIIISCGKFCACHLGSLRHDRPNIYTCGGAR